MPRHALDSYSTPAHYVEPLLELIGPLRGQRVYEPCVGQGDIARYLAGAALTTNDLDPACPADTHLDARCLEAWPVRTDWVLCNPPFSDELPILLHALACARNVAVLARLSFLEPTRDRAPVFHLHPPTDLILLPRYSFRCNDEGKRQTDSVTCCWLVWREGQLPCVTFSAWRPNTPATTETETSAIPPDVSISG